MGAVTVPAAGGQAGTVGPPALWRPNSPPQTRFLETGAYEALYGGAAGGGKSEALLLGALRWSHHPRYQGIIFRRTFPELKKHIIERSRELFPVCSPGSTYNQSDKLWRFPSGARLYFGHLEHESSVTQYQGAEFQYLGFDELTHFAEKQYRYLLSRGRSSAGIPVRIRGATNPGGEGHEWVLRRWAPWLDRSRDYAGVCAASGQVLHYRNEAGGELWVPEGDLSRVFVGAKAADNPALAVNDPGYISRLMGLDPVTRAQLLDGNWMARPATGAYFQRSWFRTADVMPAEGIIKRVRYWDRAATVPSPENPDPDWTSGTRLAQHKSGVWYVEHVERFRGRPMDVERRIQATAEQDGKTVTVVIEQDPGQAGVSEAGAYTRLLAGFIVRTVKPTGDKVTRAQPLSAQVEAGNVVLLRGAWNDAFLSELESFPEGAHDDQVDSTDGAFNFLAPASAGDRFRAQLR